MTQLMTQTSMQLNSLPMHVGQASRRRILIAIPTVTSYRLFLSELMGEMVARGWDVHFASSLDPIKGFDCYTEPIAGTVHSIRFPRGANLVGHMKAARSLNALVQRIQPDIIHCHFSVAAFTAAMARRRGWPPTIATIQGLMFPEASGWRKAVFGLAEGFAHLRLDGTWVLTQSDVNALAAFGLRSGVFLQKSSGFGCRLDRFDRNRFSATEIGALRKKCGIDDDDFVFIFVGRQVHFKGFGLVVRSFLEIARTQRRAKLLLVGQRDPLHATGLTSDEELALAKSDRIIQLGWQQDVARFFPLAHVNVFPSQREGIPVNLMESLAMGVPVITLDSRGCRDVVRTEIDGLVISEPTVTMMQSAMERMMNDEALRSRFSANALAGRDRFNRSTWIDEQVRIYEQVLARPTGSNA